MAILLAALLLKFLLLLSTGLACAYFVDKYASRSPSYKGGQYILKASPYSKFSALFVWLAATAFAIIIYLALEMDSLNGKFIGSCLVVASILFVVTVPSLIMKIIYDEERLSIELFGFSWVYKWENLKRVNEYYTSTSGALILKFNKRLRIAIPTDFVGFDHFENFVYRQSHNI